MLCKEGVCVDGFCNYVRKVYQKKQQLFSDAIQLFKNSLFYAHNINSP